MKAAPVIIAHRYEDIGVVGEVGRILTRRSIYRGFLKGWRRKQARTLFPHRLPSTVSSNFEIRKPEISLQ